MPCRAIRGAITVEENSQKAIREATKELIKKLIEANRLKNENIICIFFTTTPDLNADFPAAAVRELGWDNIPMLCSHEINVPGSLPKCIRALVLVETEKPTDKLVHVYLKDAKILKGGEKR